LHRNFCINIARAATVEGGIPDFSLQFKRLEDLILKEIGGIKTEIGGIKSVMKEIGDKINYLDDKYGSHWMRASETFEVMARSKMKRECFLRLRLRQSNAKLLSSLPRSLYHQTSINLFQILKDSAKLQFLRYQCAWKHLIFLLSSAAGP
jgi:hypothetical protein